MQQAFGEYAPDVYARDNLNASHFQDLKAYMRFTPTFKGTCAVVGSSSSLLKSADGALIDSADTVVRVNAVPKLPELYAAYTGKRTDVLVTHFDKHVHRKSFTVIPPTVYYCISATMSRACWNNVRKDGMFRVSPRLVRRVRRSHGLWPWPSTGFIAFEVANMLCDEVRLYGFGIDPLFSNCSHYYNTLISNPARCGKRGLDAWAGSFSQDHQTYVKASWHNLRREAMLVRDHPFALPVEAREYSPYAIEKKRAALRKERQLAAQSSGS